MKNLVLLLVFLFAAVASAASPASTQSEIVIGLPGTLRPDSAKTVLGSIDQIIKSVPPGSRLSIYDAERQQRIGVIVKPTTKNKRKEAVLIKKQAAPLLKHLSRKSSVREGQADRILLPSFLSLIESTLTSKASETRLMIFASPFYTADGDPSSFGDGVIPGDGFVLASSEDSVFGTADQNKALDGLHVDYCYFREGIFKRGEREKRAVNRFISVYLSELGATLTSFSASADVVVERALAGSKDPSTRAKIDREDTALVLREVAVPERKVEKVKKEEPKQEPLPAPVMPVVARQEREPEPTPVLVEPVIVSEPRSVDFVLVLDGSISQGDELDYSTRMIAEMAEKSAEVEDTFVRIGIVIYRNQSNTDVLPMTTIKVPGLESRDGLRRVETFLGESFRTVSIANFTPGDEVGKATGETRKISRMEPIGCYVDFAHGIGIGTRMLEGTKPGTVPVMLLVGDAVHELGDPQKANDLEDLRASEESLKKVAKLAGRQPELCVFSVFTGADRKGIRFGPEAERFFRNVAKKGGRNAEFMESMDGAKSKVLQLLTGRESR